jgi:hypothetical protein
MSSAPIPQRTISSAYTLWMKFVFPIFWIVGFGFGTFIVWFETARGRNGEPPPEVIKYIFALIWITGTSFILWLAIRLKGVRTDATNLYVSKGFRQITVPLEEISKVKTGGSTLIQLPSTSRMRPACGTNIMFMPTRRFALWSAHPIVAELKQLAGLAP